MAKSDGSSLLMVGSSPIAQIMAANFMMTCWQMEEERKEGGKRQEKGGKENQGVLGI